MHPHHRPGQNRGAGPHDDASTLLTAVPITRKSLLTVYQQLFGCYGPQHWWPAESPFEVMVGAILTQNTAWSNVEKALASLVAHDRLDATKIIATRRDHLANWLRPSGYFNVKAVRLKNFCRWYLDAGGFGSLSGLDTTQLRQMLLSVNGVGPETADDMLLYAFERPVFVIDAYTRRLFARLRLLAANDSYDSLRTAIESALGPDVTLFNEYHALIVRHAKEVCRQNPRCARCVLLAHCPEGTE